MDFKTRYQNLNQAQKQAVDTIDGPVMVIAGPGTGKTELLGVRVANILQKTDTLPENILCLTFTESGATAMRERLTEIIGKDAYKVAIHTFHSFCEEIINQNGKYFYQGAEFHVADELSTYEIIRGIFDQLDYTSQISSKQNDEYTYLKDSVKIISELKESGFLSDEINKILDDNNEVLEYAEKLLSPVFSSIARISKKIIPYLAKQIEPIRKSAKETNLPNITSLAIVISNSLEQAVEQAEKDNKTTPITAWRNRWFEKDNHNKFVMKSRVNQIKLRSLVYVYAQYLKKMQEASLYDFDDMILRVAHAMEVFDDLRFNLQEKYQYIMVDEFQDTNMAQMRILNNLTNNISQGDMPNIMIVGDDDQAIYSFQGADISNILNFQENYPKAKTISLKDNYRSTAEVLDLSRGVIIQGNERLEDKYESLNKQLTSHVEHMETGVFIHEAENISDERRWLVQSIKDKITDGEKPNNIAVFTRRHAEIHKLLPYFYQANIPVNYEKRDNAIEAPIIILIEKLSRLIINIANGEHESVNASLPEILAHKMWGINPTKLWRLSLESYKNRSTWLEIMSNDEELKPIFDWLINTSAQIFETPLEQMLDIIIGSPKVTESDDESFISPLYNHFFSNESREKNPEEYLSYLEALRSIRSKLREYRPDQSAQLTNFIEFIELNRKTGKSISVVRRSAVNETAINIMTAHKSKGLEFKHVYIVNAIDSAWGARVHSRSRLISYPENLKFAKAGDSQDERLRLFYVAMTRAKQNLNISYSLCDDNGKNTSRAYFLSETDWEIQKIDHPSSTEDLIKAAELDWYQPLINPIKTDMRELILPKMQDYKLSVTHLHNFLDVTHGGPDMFFLQNILHFPRAKSPSASFGTAIHTTLQQAHTFYSTNGKKQEINDILKSYETNLANQHMAKKDFDFYLKKGSDALQAYLEKNYDRFKISEQAELDFKNQNSLVGEAKIDGKLDLVNIDKDEKTMAVYDYKTGKAMSNWYGKEDYDKIKLHKYKQQLMFYKLLVENSRDWHTYEVNEANLHFVEPSKSGDIYELNINFNSEEIEKFKKLLLAVWNHIINLDLPDVSKYDKSIKGILDFEQDLIDNI